MYDPNMMGLLFYFITKEKGVQEDSCHNKTSYEKERSGCRCNEENVCVKTNVRKIWPNAIDMLGELRDTIFVFSRKKVEE